MESAYRECMIIELSAAHLSFATERHVKLDYKGHAIGSAFRLDLLIENALIVELKAIECVETHWLSRGTPDQLQRICAEKWDPTSGAP
ncbi:MAG TPA: GxxExxY protein [Vicinamibacterales bacterium]|nr:GxxExxY protein [Vicinamibacterales bacterium]